MCLGGRALCNSGLAAILRLDKRADHARFRRGNNNILFLNYALTVISLSPADNREKYCRIAAMSAEQSGPPQERHGLNASRTRVNARKMTLIKFTSPPACRRTRHAEIALAVCNREIYTIVYYERAEHCLGPSVCTPKCRSPISRDVSTALTATS